MRKTDEIKERLAIVLAALRLEPLFQAPGFLVAAGVIDDAHRRQVKVRKACGVLEASLFQCELQHAHRPFQRAIEAGPLPGKEIVGLFEEMLNIHLVHAIPMAVLVGLFHHLLVGPAHHGSHLLQGLAPQVEHGLPVGRVQQFLSRFRKGASSIQRVAHAQGHHLVDRRDFLAGNGPDLSAFLAGQRRKEVDGQGSTLDRRGHRFKEIRFEPGNIIFGGHPGSLHVGACQWAAWMSQARRGSGDSKTAVKTGPYPTLGIELARNTFDRNGIA
ncbi:hypothetical protein D3C85_1209170 [compost metagenome]